ncbi:MAG: glycosyltransferase family 4 protein [Lachnospiraceae bacterium]|nr:glycosyltransferase family 4 protein [Lachnospiraceae bacterium]
MKKPKVLMIGPARSVHGGISGVVNNYYEAGLDEKIELCYIGTMVEGSKPRKLLQAMLALAVFLVKVPGYEIVHVNVASDASYVRKSVFIRVAKLFGKKIVIHQHGGDFEGYYEKQLNDKGRAGVRKVLSMGDAFLVLAPAYKALFEKITGRKDILVFPDSIEIPAVYEKEYGQKKILFLGRLCEAKGVRELLKAMDEVHLRFPDAHLYMGGIWEDKQLKELATERSDYVTYIGWVSGEEKKKYLKECDIFVLPSYFEGQSVAILEAMAYSCGIVASDIGGIPQMITEGETGILIQPKDADSLKRGLEKLLEDEELCRRLGKKAREKVEKEFSIEQNMKQLLEVYQQILR